MNITRPTPQGPYTNIRSWLAPHARARYNQRGAKPMVSVPTRTDVSGFVYFMTQQDFANPVASDRRNNNEY